MDPFTLAMIAGGTTALGSHMANTANARSSAKQMRFQERMANTAYQRQMRDMQLAGINPMLAMSSGGASTPSGASAPSSNVLENAVSSAIQANLAKEQVKQLKSGTQLNKAMQKKALSESKYYYSNAKGIQIDNRIKKGGLPKIEYREDMDKTLLGKAKMFVNWLFESNNPRSLLDNLRIHKKWGK
ncbi:DNA pilot protein [Microviridae sp.]|nr:DNA pilot protein [Microviridae sp.]